jgi:hypothetical protein
LKIKHEEAKGLETKTTRTTLKSGTVPPSLIMRKMPEQNEDNHAALQAGVEDNPETTSCRKLKIGTVPTSPNSKESLLGGTTPTRKRKLDNSTDNNFIGISRMRKNWEKDDTGWKGASIKENLLRSEIPPKNLSRIEKGTKVNEKCTNYFGKKTTPGKIHSKGGGRGLKLSSEKNSKKVGLMVDFFEKNSKGKNQRRLIEQNKQQNKQYVHQTTDDTTGLYYCSSRQFLCSTNERRDKQETNLG